MYVIAVTGGLGAGKTEATRFLEARGARVLDLDALAKDLLEPGTDVYDAVVAAFGKDILAGGERIVHRRLADEAFRCDATATTLSAIVHPPVVEEVGRALQDLALQAKPPRVVVMEAPLLAENPALAEMSDLVVAIEAHEDLRIARAVERGMDAVDARARIDRQASDADRAEVADVVIENAGTSDEFHSELGRLWDERVAPQLPSPKE